MSSSMPRSPPTPPVQLVSPNGSARRNRLLGLHEDARAGSGGEEQPLHAVDVVGIPGLEAELTAAADVLSRLDESPLCYFQWYAVSPEQHAFVRLALRSNGGRWEDSLLAVARPIQGARQPRIICSQELVGAYLLVTVRPKNAHLLGADTRPLVGLTKTVVDGHDPRGEAPHSREDGVDDAQATPGGDSASARGAERGDKAMALGATAVRAAKGETVSVGAPAIIPPEPRPVDAAPVPSPVVVSTTDTASMWMTTNSLDSLRGTVMALEHAQRVSAADIAALREMQTQARAEWQTTFAQYASVLSTQRDALRAAQEQVAKATAEMEKRMQADMQLLAGEWAALRADQDELRRSSAAAKLQQAHAASEQAALESKRARVQLQRRGALAQAPASAEKHTQQVSSQRRHPRPLFELDGGALRFLAGVSIALLAAALLVAFRHTAAHRVADIIAHHRASVPRPSPPPLPLAVPAVNSLAAHIAHGGRLAQRSATQTPLIRANGTALTSWLLAAAHEATASAQALRRHTFPPSQRSLLALPPSVSALWGARKQESAPKAKQVASSWTLRRAAAAVAAGLVRVLRAARHLAAFLVVCLAAAVMVFAVMRCVAAISRVRGKKKQGGAPAHSPHRTPPHQHHHSGGAHGRGSGSSMLLRQEDGYGIDRTPGGHWHSRRVHDHDH